MVTKYVAQRQFVSPVFGHMAQGQEIVIDEADAGISQLVALDQLVDLGDLVKVAEPAAESADATDIGDNDGKPDPGKAESGPTQTPTNPGPTENK